jgi:hypothetical protein
MTTNALHKLHGALAGMDEVLARAHGGKPDVEALLEFRRFCWTALLAVDDGECQQHIDLLVQISKELYSEREPDRVAVLRGDMGTALAALRARVQGLERGYGKRWRDLRAA